MNLSLNLCSLARYCVKSSSAPSTCRKARIGLPFGFSLYRIQIQRFV